MGKQYALGLERCSVNARILSSQRLFGVTQFQLLAWVNNEFNNAGSVSILQFDNKEALTAVSVVNHLFRGTWKD